MHGVPSVPSADDDTLQTYDPDSKQFFRETLAEFNASAKRVAASQEINPHRIALREAFLHCFSTPREARDFLENGTIPSNIRAFHGHDQQDPVTQISLELTLAIKDTLPDEHKKPPMPEGAQDPFELYWANTPRLRFVDSRQRCITLSGPDNGLTNKLYLTQMMTAYKDNDEQVGSLGYLVLTNLPNSVPLTCPQKMDNLVINVLDNYPDILPQNDITRILIHQPAEMLNKESLLHLYDMTRFSAHEHVAKLINVPYLPSLLNQRLHSLLSEPILVSESSNVTESYGNVLSQEFMDEASAPNRNAATILNRQHLHYALRTLQVAASPTAADTAFSPMVMN